jgi:hypothetical protein
MDTFLPSMKDRIPADRGRAPWASMTSVAGLTKSQPLLMPNREFTRAEGLRIRPPIPPAFAGEVRGSIRQKLDLICPTSRRDSGSQGCPIAGSLSPGANFSSPSRMVPKSRCEPASPARATWNPYSLLDEGRLTEAHP